VKLVEKDDLGSATSEQRFVWCGRNQPCEERNSSNVVTRRWFDNGEHVPGASSPADKLFYTTDHLGSVRELTDDDEVVRARYDYDPYGRTTKLTGDLETVAGYTGHHRHDKSGLYLTWFREYDPDLGRWLSRDPIGESGGTTLYGYAANDPVRFADRLGLYITYGCGTPEFWEQFKKMFDKMWNTPTGRKMLEMMYNSDWNFNINGGFEGQKEPGLTISNDTKRESFTYIKEDLYDRTLPHEAQHGLEHAYGSADPVGFGFPSDTTKNGREYRAVGASNQVAREAGKDRWDNTPQKEYGRLKVPSAYW
jgi:RHS repeat-associated protein